jgi:hypothetical protein
MMFLKKDIMYLLILIIVIISCKQESKQVNKEKEKLSFSDSIAASGRIAKPTEISKDKIKSEHKFAQGILTQRIKTKPKNWIILDAGVWEYEFVYKDGAMSKQGEYTGKWIDMDENNNYKYGYYDVMEGSGKYHYDNDTHMLLLVDDDETTMPQEFELKIQNDMMIMMGRNTFGNNAIQAKLIKRNNVPSKK